MRQTKVFGVFIIVLFCINYNQLVKAQSADEQCCDLLMETITTLAGTNLFQVYLNITLMNDNVDLTENYELFDGVLFSLDKQLITISEQLSKFNKNKCLSKEDFDYLFQLKEIVFLLQEDIKLFRKFIGKGNDDAYKIFYLNHNKTYKKLNELLELEEPDTDNSGGE